MLPVARETNKITTVHFILAFMHSFKPLWNVFLHLMLLFGFLLLLLSRRRCRRFYSYSNRVISYLIRLPFRWCVFHVRACVCVPFRLIISNKLLSTLNNARETPHHANTSVNWIRFELIRMHCTIDRVSYTNMSFQLVDFLNCMITSSYSHPFPYPPPLPSIVAFFTGTTTMMMMMKKMVMQRKCHRQLKLLN